MPQNEDVSFGFRGLLQHRVVVVPYNKFEIDNRDGSA
jgi:hypothetical protein